MTATKTFWPGQAHGGPIAGAIADGLQMLADDRNALKRESYERGLQQVDWDFEFSDDGRKVRRVRSLIDDLRIMQREVDPSAEIWNRYASPAYRMEANT